MRGVNTENCVWFDNPCVNDYGCCWSGTYFCTNGMCSTKRHANDIARANSAEVADGYTKPKDNECLLWPDPNFNGTPESITLDTSKCKGGPYTYESGSEVKYYFLDNFNDKLDSWACGKEVAFDFCNNHN